MTAGPEKDRGRPDRPSLALDADGAFDIHDYIPYLVNRAAIVLVERFQDGLRDKGVTRTEWRVLAILCRRGPTRFGALASLAALEPSTLSRLLSGLRKRGMVLREPSEVDARGVLIAPTEAAHAMVRAILPHAIATERVAVEGMSDDEARFFLRLLQRLCDNLAPWVPDDEGRA